MSRVSAHFKVAGRAARIADRVRNENVLPFEDDAIAIDTTGKQLILDQQIPSIQLKSGISGILHRIETQRKYRFTECRFRIRPTD